MIRSTQTRSTPLRSTQALLTPPGRMRRLWLVPVLVLLLAPPPTRAQEQAVLYAGLIKSKGYTVGSPLAASGLQRYEGDTLWTHIGWNNPRISGISVDPGRPDTLFLAAGNGVLRTRDGGATWVLTTDWRITESQDIAVDPNDPAQVYVGTGYGVWRSEDGGDTWIASNEGLPEPYTQSIEVDRTTSGRVLAATAGGLYLSEDGARSWRLVGADGMAALDIQQSPLRPERWVAGTQEHGIYVSEDGGATWRAPRGRLAGTSIYGVAVDPTDADRMAGVGWDAGVWVSENGGRRWTRRGEALPVPHGYEAIFDANVPGRLWVATVEEGIFHSDDLGKTWESAGMYGTLVFDMLFVDP